MILYQAITADPAWQPKDKLPGKSRGAAKNYKTMPTEKICRLAKYVGGFDAKSAIEIRLSMSGKSCVIADDAILFLWRLSSMQTDALEVAHRWGFTHKSELVWAKYWPCMDCRGAGGGRHTIGGVLRDWICELCNGTGCGTPWFGMGRYLRNAHETCLIATRGAMTTRILAKNIRSVLHAPVPCTWSPSKAKNAKKGQMVARPIHSAKPERFYADIVEKLVDGPYLELFGRRRRRGWMVLGNQVDKFARVA